MTRPRPMPVASYAPQLLDWLVRGAAGEVRLRGGPGANLAQTRIRLNMLRRAMEREGHPLAAAVAAVVVRIEGDQLVVSNRDAGIEALQEVGGREGALRQIAEPMQFADLPGEDPLAELLVAQQPAGSEEHA